MSAPLAAASFETYQRVRDRVAPLRGLAPAADVLTASEREVRALLQPLWEASPEMIAELRRWAHVVTGVRASDGDDGGSGARRTLERQLRRLLKHGTPSLWVDEPLTLGGFGWDGPVARYNADTVRFFRVVSLLQEAAVLTEIREQEIPGKLSRASVWEIGGWGGFAYQIKTLCPGVVYLTTGFPETLLLAAVYLATLFPAARLRFFDPARPEAFWDDWQAIDFAFAPEGVWRRCPVSIDLSVDLAMLERMTPGRIEAHVARAHADGSRYFLSICPSSSPAGAEAAVLPALTRYYWRHPFSEPSYAVRRLGLSADSASEPHSEFFLGWRRLQV